MSGSNSRKLARVIANKAAQQSEKAASVGRTKIGVVASVDPLTIQPLGGGVALPAEALMWSNIAMLTRDQWEEGYTVAMSMLDSNTYLVHDVIDVGENLSVAEAGSVPDHATSHESGGGDEITGPLSANARVGVRKNNTGTPNKRRTINFTEGTNVGITVTDDAGDEETNVQIDVVSAAPTGSASGDLTGSYPGPSIANGAVTDAKVAAGAAIAYSKLNLAGSIVNADIASGAAIALSKLATDPLARANHTGTQLAATISDFTAAVQAITGPQYFTRDQIVALIEEGDDEVFNLAIARAQHTGTQLAATISDFNAAASGASAAGAATVGGDLTGTVANAQIAAGAIVNADINSAAAIAYSKLALSNSIVNADIGAAAAIAYSKLNLSGSIVNADIAGGAAIALSKLATDPLARANHTGTQLASTISDFATAVALLTDAKYYDKDTSNNMLEEAMDEVFNLAINRAQHTGTQLAATISDFNAAASGASAAGAATVGGDLTGTVANAQIAAGAIVNADINSGAAIAYSKLALSNSIVNADIGAAAAIAYSKLNLSSSIVNADVSGSAAIAYSKLALTGSIVNADIGAAAAIAYSKLALSNSIVNADIGAAAAIAYSKLNLSGSIVNADIASGAAIALSKLATDPLARANHTGTQTRSTISDFAHASTHVTGGSDQIDGDELDIDLVTANYTPSAGTPGAAGTLSAYLRGIDNAFGALVLPSEGVYSKSETDARILGAFEEAAADDHNHDALYAKLEGDASKDYIHNMIEEAISELFGGYDSLEMKYMSRQSMIGNIVDTARTVAPPGWAMCYGQALDRTTYSDLFTAIVNNKGTFTVTLASPGVFTLVAHGLAIGDPVFATTTGALPTGMSANTIYYVKTVPTADTFTLGTTRTITAKDGTIAVTTDVNTSVSQSGTHTLYHAPYEISSATTFNVPDYRGRMSIAPDNMGGSDAARLGAANTVGLPWGEATHLLTGAESGTSVHTHADTFSATQAAHNHTHAALNGWLESATSGGTLANVPTTGSSYRYVELPSNTPVITISGAVSNSAAADASTAHNNIPLVVQTNSMIFTGV